MENDRGLARSIRSWTEMTVPGESDLADAAVSLALRCYAAGASVSEATEMARLFVASWCRHPSHVRSRHPQVGLAS
jgi:hypothetical protein